MNNKRIALFLLCLSGLIIRCSVTTLAGGSDNPDFIVTGAVTDSLGRPAPAAVVTIAPASYNPIADKTRTVVLTDTTNSRGEYCFALAQKGTYAIQAVHSLQRTRLFIAGISVQGDTTPVPPAALTAPGTVKVALDFISAAASTGYIYVPGTSLVAFIHDNLDTVVLDSVPAGVLPALSYAAVNSPKSIDLRYDVSVAPGELSMVHKPSWLYTGKLILNTSASGANISGRTINFPIVVRLTADNFKFSQARAGGADIRFTNSNNAFLPYEIEQWDSSKAVAAVWVKVDTIMGNSDSQYITMYWGNAAAEDSSNAVAVFDTANGFQGVWHMAGVGYSTAYDATGNHYDGMPYNMTAVSSIPGPIGGARSFNGISQYIAMPYTAASKLNMRQNGDYSLSMWVWADSIDTLWHAIAGKGHEQFYVKLKCFGKNRATWEFVEFQDGAGWEYTEDSTPPAPGSKLWVNITGVREGNQQRLYINGTLVSSAVKRMGGNYARNTGDDFMVGRHARLVTIPYYEGWDYFGGKVDEIRVSSVVLSPDWIKLCYMNQRADDRLVIFETNGTKTR